MIPKLTKIWHGWKVNARHLRRLRRQLAELNADDMLTCIQRNEKISTVAGRIMSFAGLRYYQLTTDGERTKFLSDAQEKITVFTTPLVFFTLELNRLSEEALTALFDANADLARYRPAIRVFAHWNPINSQMNWKNSCMIWALLGMLGKNCLMRQSQV